MVREFYANGTSLEQNVCIFGLFINKSHVSSFFLQERDQKQLKKLLNLFLLL